MNRWVTIGICLWTLASAANAAAQEPAAVPLTLTEALARAQEQSHRLAEARARADGADAAIARQLAATRPTVALTAGYTRTNHVDEFGVPQPGGGLRVIYPDVPDNYFSRAVLQWPIYTAGRSDALIHAAEAESRAASADLAVAQADLRLEVVRAYWALVTAIESVRVVQEGLTRADAHLRDVQSRFASGLIPPNEVSAVEAQRARQQLQLIEVQNLRSSVHEDLRRLTGIEGEILPVEPLDRAPDDAAPTAIDRAELTALDERLTAAEFRVAAVRAHRRPSVSLNAAADYANPNPRIFPRQDRWRPSWELGAVVSWTLWDGGRVAAEAAEATAHTRALAARRADVGSSITSDVRQRRLDLDSAVAALSSANAAVTSAAEARRVVTERFAVGVATSTEVLDAHVALLQAELDRMRTLAAIRLAEARLARAVGR